MTGKSALVPNSVENRIVLVRGQKVLLDTGLAALYGVEVKALNQAVKRNEERFPTDFVFQLTAEENEGLRSQTVTSKPKMLMANTVRAAKMRRGINGPACYSIGVQSR